MTLISHDASFQPQLTTIKKLLGLNTKDYQPHVHAKPNVPLTSSLLCFSLPDNATGRVDTYIQSESLVTHMEVDQYRPGHIIFADGSAIKTTDGINTSLIVGNANDDRGKSE